MNLKRILWFAPLLLLTLAGVLVLAWPGSSLTPQPGHTLMHLNCPPGSHGKPRFTGVGQSLERARNDARAARSLEQRAITAQ
ncbi:MAG: hypothetical protein ABL901_12490 [Hyphomicrobiaceae bacterium]